MRKTILYISLGFLSFLFIVVVGFTIGSLRGTAPKAVHVSNVQTQAPKTTTQENTWVAQLAKVESKSQNFPVNELLVELSLQKVKPPKEHIFQLIIDKNDSYSFFCLMQTLKFFSIPYSIVKENNNKKVLISAKQKSELNKIAVELKKYNIDSIIKEAWL